MREPLLSHLALLGRRSSLLLDLRDRLDLFASVFRDHLSNSRSARRHAERSFGPTFRVALNLVTHAYQVTDLFGVMRVYRDDIFVNVVRSAILRRDRPRQ